MDKSEEIAEWMATFCTLFVDQNGVEYILVNHPDYPENNGLYEVDSGRRVR